MICFFTQTIILLKGGGNSSPKLKTQGLPCRFFMKQTQEFEGKNVEQAIENACKTLNVTKKKLSYDVISSGSSGIFGIVGVKKARIRVSLPDKKSSSNGVGWDSVETDDIDGIMSIVDEAFGETPAKPKDTPRETPRKKQKKSQPKKATPPEEQKKDSLTREKPETVADKPCEEEKAKPAKKEKNRSLKSGDKTPEPKPEKEIKIKPDTVIDEPEQKDNSFNGEFDEEIDDRDEGYPPKYKDEIPVDVSEASVALGLETLQKMVDLITNESKVVASTDQDRLLLRVEGGNSGVLIGRRGQTLEAMQFLTDKIINRKSESRVRLKVDIEGYMETRKANLQSLAHKMAEKAKKTGKPATINQMTAQDRRIVHIALKDDTRVRTQSMGDGYYRRLVIFPKKGTFKKRPSSRK